MPGRQRGLAEEFSAFATLNRLQATVGYNAAMVALAVGIGVLIATEAPSMGPMVSAGLYATGAVLLKLHASIADAIHDRAADAVNPEKSVVAMALTVIGAERAWTLLVVELVVGMTAVGAAAMHTTGWLLIAGATVAICGFTYSYPPRIKERGLWNHVVTTGVDVGLLVVPVAAIVGGGVNATVVVIASVVACYSFGYHVMHQTADTHYDRLGGLRTFATAVGVGNAVAVAARATAVATGLAVALGYPSAVLVTGGITAYYVWLYCAVVGRSTREACVILSQSFSIAWIASLLNGVLAVAVWWRVVGRPVVPTALLG